MSAHEVLGIARTRTTHRRPELTIISLSREIAELQATLFRLDPTPERLTAWADTYGTLPDEEGH